LLVTPTASVVVVGSLNMDFVVQVARLPAPGETVLGSGFQTIPGGKGANQACAAGRLGGSAVRTCMVGRVGMDPFGDQLKASLAAAGVDVSTVLGTRALPTGVALIWVEQSGQNSIVVASGANGAVTPADIESVRAQFAGARCALFQLETPVEAVEAAMSVLHEAGVVTILDPAPAQPLAAALLRQVSILTPNETEACILLGRPPARVSLKAAPELARALLALGPQAVVLKLGDQGAFYSDGDSIIESPGFSVDPVDTTAAGDTFNAGFAVGLAEGKSVAEALRFANAAAAVSVTRLGAQSSVPARSEVEEFLAQRAAG
jgi:ribokinase